MSELFTEEIEETLGIGTNTDRIVEAIKELVKPEPFRFDEFISEPTTGAIDLSNRLRSPFTLQYILATWDVSATVAQLLLGKRIIPLPPTTGQFIFEGEIRLEPRDLIQLNITTAAVKPCFLELMGYFEGRRQGYVKH